MKIIPLTSAHMLEAWNRLPPVTCHGLAVVEGDKLMGLAAVWPDEPNQRLILVSHIGAAGRALLAQGKQCRTLLVACRQALRIAARWKVPVHAVADPAIPGSVNLLRHLNFTHYRGDTYSWQA
jgi:hypothetical protein